MSTIYLVCGAWYDYESSSVWNVKAFTDEQLARAHAAMCQKSAELIYAEVEKMRVTHNAEREALYGDTIKDPVSGKKIWNIEAHHALVAKHDAEEEALRKRLMDDNCELYRLNDVSYSVQELELI